jgi:hypothetical protein
MRGRTAIILVALAIICAGIGFAEIIPRERRVEWNPGIPGGIPARTKIFASVKDAPYNALGDNRADDTKAIQKAIDACPAGQVVFIPEGTYRTRVSLKLTKGIVLRGAGTDKSRIILDTDFPIIIDIGNVPERQWRRNWHGRQNPEPDYEKNFFPVTGGLGKGSKTIELGDASRFSAGDLVIIDQRDDLSVIKMGSQDNGWWFKRNEHGFSRSVGQILKIMSKKGSALELESPLYYDYSAPFKPEVYSVINTTGGIVSYAGVEDLYLARNKEFQGQGAMIRMQSAAYCWAKNVETFKVSGRHIPLSKCYRCVVRDSYIHHGWNYASGGNSYGICLDEYSTDCLAENNIVYYLNNAMTFECAGGGNVLAYNYGDSSPLSYFYDWAAGELGTHAAWPVMELVEGNQLSRICFDNYHGGSGYMTVFRNYASGSQLPLKEIRFRSICGIELQGNTYFTNIVGNVLMQPGLKGIYEMYKTEDNCNAMSAYVLGYVDCCESGLGSDSMVYDTLLRHGNFDYITNSVKWDPKIPDRNIPDSLYLKSKPEFFGDTRWPSFGPDLSPMVVNNPARERFLKIQKTAEPGLPETVRDGIGKEDIDIIYSGNKLSANWDETINTASYWYAIGTRPGGTDIAGWTDNGNVRYVTRTGLSLKPGTKYYFSVKAANMAGLQGEAAGSNGQLFRQMDPNDRTPPEDIEEVRDGSGRDLFTATAGDQMKANWKPSADPESGIAKYWYAIGTRPGGTDMVDWTDNGEATAVTREVPGLKADTRYYFSVKAQNGAGLKSGVTSSDGQVVLGAVNYSTSAAHSPNTVIMTGKDPAVLNFDGKKNAEASVYTLIGRPVKKLDVSKGAALWDGKDRNGREVENGMYIYEFKDSTGRQKIGKILLKR